MIGWWEDNFTVGPRAAAAKQSLLRLIPHIMPRDGDQASLYRLVLDHWDFGIHNMSIAIDTNGQPRVTSIYDWETGCIMPAILSDPSMAVCSVDLVTDGTAAPLITRLEGNETPDELAQYMAWARHYCEVCSILSKPISREVIACCSRFSSIKRLITSVPSRQGRCAPYLVCFAKVAR